MHDPQQRLSQCTLALILLAFAGASPLLGQDPFGEENADVGAEPVVPFADYSRYGPAIRTVMEAERQTPEELLQGVLLLVDLGEPKLAKPLFARLTQLNPDDAAKAALARRFGTNRMMRLARSKPGLGDEAATFADACMAALAAELRDPKRLAKLVEELDDSDVAVRRAAITDLIQAGPDTAPFCVAALVDPKQADRREGLTAVLVELRPASSGPLVAALAVESPDAKAAVIGALGRIAPRQVHLLAPALVDPNERVRQAAAHVLLQTNGRLPTMAEAEAVMSQSVEAYLAGQLPAAPDADGRVAVWIWNAEAMKPVVRQVAVKDASVLAAGQLADDLAALVPGNHKYQMLRLLCRLQRAKLDAGMDEPLAETVKKSVDRTNTRLLEATFAEAVRRDLIPAAIAAAELLGELGEASSIYGRAPATTPLVDALRHGDRRLRFAALTAVMQIKPSTPFAGASRMPEAIEFFLRGGQRRAIVAMPDRIRAQTIAGWLTVDDLVATSAGTGREALLAAIHSSNVELVLIDAAINGPGIRETLYQLRGQPSVRRAPIGVLAGPATFQKADRIAAGHPSTVHFARPQDPEAAQAITAKLFALAKRSNVPGEVRAKQASDALTWLDALLDRPRTFYDLRRLEPVVRDALTRPALADRAAATLGHFGSADTQRALVDAVSQSRIPSAGRQTAALAFRRSVARYGLQLSREEILRQYDRYNASETADRPTQQVLGHILDTIEKRGGR